MGSGLGLGYQGLGTRLLGARAAQWPLEARNENQETRNKKWITFLVYYLLRLWFVDVFVHIFSIVSMCVLFITRLFVSL